MAVICSLIHSMLGEHFVLARCFNIEQAEQMFREVCYWTLHSHF